MQYNQQIYVWKIVLQKFNTKYDKSNGNTNISGIIHFSFVMLCYLLEIIIAWCKMQWQTASTLKRIVVQNCAPGTTK